MTPSEATAPIVAEESAVWPWQAEPYKLWSLLDMKSFDVSAVAQGACNLAIAAAQAKTSALATTVSDSTVENVRKQLAHRNVHVHVEGVPALADAFRGPIREKMLACVQVAEGALADATLPRRYHDKIERVKEMIAEEYNGEAVSALFTELVHDLMAELSEPMFLYIRPDRRHLYEQKEPPFGQLVSDKFDQSSRDIAAAARCLALDEWTACVFHLMRALEPALHLLADKVGVTFPAPIDLENWKNIVDKIDAEVIRQVKALEGTAKSHERNAELKFYGEASVQMRHFKNAWRNDAAHGREHYDEREAERVYGAVKHFMEIMTANA